MKRHKLFPLYIKLLFVLAGVGGGAGIAELWARQMTSRYDATRFFVPSEDPQLLYELKPGVSGLFDGLSLGRLPETHLSINSVGFRGKEYPVSKPENTYRIALLGDSVAFGWGVEIEDSIGYQLEMLLNRRKRQNKRFEVLNFGIPGYNTAQEVRLLEIKVLPYSPDLILLFFTQNDFCPAIDISRIRARWGWLLQRSALARIMLAWVLVRQNAGHLRTYASGPGLREIEMALSRLASLSKEHNFSVVVTFDYTDGLCKIVEDYAKSRSLRMVTFNYSGVLSGFHEQTKFPAPDSHPNTIGHRLMAIMTYRVLTERGILR